MQQTTLNGVFIPPTPTSSEPFDRQTSVAGIAPHPVIKAHCWIGLSLANTSGLILAVRVGKDTPCSDRTTGEQLSGKTDCQHFNSDKSSSTLAKFLAAVLSV